MLTPISKEQIKHMVDRFLCWRLPENFNPDAGISFKKTFNEQTAHPMKHEPSGTNLFDATQADAMVRYMVEGIPSNPDFRWLIEAPGQRYLSVRHLTGANMYDFIWVADHNAALAFKTQEQADLTMMAVRQMNHELFAFAATLGEARPVEHGWM